jgi:hypothetical protein
MIKKFEISMMGGVEVLSMILNQATQGRHLHQPNTVHSKHTKKFEMKDAKTIKTSMGTNGHLDIDT